MMDSGSINKGSFPASSWIIPLGLAILLILASTYNYLLFHTLAELFAIIVAILISVVAWQMYPFTGNHFLMYLGSGYFWVASIDLFHTMTYKGLAILEVTGSNVGVQYWLSARYMEAFLLVTAPFFLARKLNRNLAFFAYAIASIFFVYSINTQLFPVGYIDGKGLTDFKVISEYVIIFVLMLSIINLVYHQQYMERRILKVVIVSIVLTICAELAFTFYIGVYDLSNLMGHIFKLFSFWLIFMAMIRTTLQDPFATLSESADTYDAIPDATIIIDQMGYIRQANESASKISGLSRKELIGQKDHDVFHGRYLPEEMCPVCQRIRSSMEVRDLDLQMDDLDKFFSFTVSSLKGVSGGNLSVEVIRDVSEKRQTEFALRQSQKMEALGKLTGGIAHDFNNVLNVVHGFSELLITSLKENPKLLEYARHINHAGERGEKLTQKLLQFSRNKNAVAASVVNINSLLSEEKEILNKVLTASINFEIDLADNLKDIWIEPNDFEDALLNLAINAMHAMNGKGTLTIRTRNEFLDEITARSVNLEVGEYVVMIVSDTGCGMDRETQARIFDPFFSTKGENGTGLGLSQVYGFVQRSGGSIKVYSELDVGTRFVFYFPAYEDEQEDFHDVELDSKSNAGGDETILVVDDEEAMVVLVKEILSSHGYQVLTADCPAMAMQMLEKTPVDLMVSDVIMPGENGYQLAARVKTLYPDIKIQMMSGFSDSIKKEDIDEELSKNQIAKPFNASTILKRVRVLLDS